MERSKIDTLRAEAHMENAIFDKNKFDTEFKDLFERNFSFWVKDLSPFKKWAPGEIVNYLKFRIRTWLDQKYAQFNIISTNYVIAIVEPDENTFEAVVSCEYRGSFFSNAPDIITAKSNSSRLSEQDAAAKLLLRTYEEVTLYGYRHDRKSDEPMKKLVFASMDRMHKKLS